MTKHRHFWQRLLIIVGLILVVLILRELYFSFLPEIKLLFNFTPHNQRLFTKLIREHGFRDMFFMFMITQIFGAIPGLSSGIFCVLNGVVFGSFFGFLINWLSAVVGQMLVLFSMEYLSRDEDFKSSHYLKRIMEFPYPKFGLTLCYVVPFIPNITVNYANIRLIKKKSQRLIPLIIGEIPMAFIYAYGGDAILHLDIKRITSAIIIFIFISIIIYLVFKVIHSQRQKLKSTP